MVFLEHFVGEPYKNAKFPSDSITNSKLYWKLYWCGVYKVAISVVGKRPKSPQFYPDLGKVCALIAQNQPEFRICYHTQTASVKFPPFGPKTEVMHFLHRKISSFSQCGKS